MESSELQLDLNTELPVPSKPTFPRRSHFQFILILLLVVGGGIGLWRVLAPSHESPPAAAQQLPMPLAYYPSEFEMYSHSYLANIS